MKNNPIKIFLLLMLCINSLRTLSQAPDAAFDGKKWIAPYSLEFPKGWDVERFLIPISFAPSIPYKGVEDLRFTPGWGDAKTDEYWSYAFLWYLDGKQKTTPEIIESNLTAYYTGLVRSNIEPRKIPADKLVPVKATFKQIKKASGDVKTFSGSVYMLDYMSQQPITLNCIVHLRTSGVQDKTFIFYEISPKPFTHPTWQSLQQLWANFKMP
jgi:hypothetical protein